MPVNTKFKRIRTPQINGRTKPFACPIYSQYPTSGNTGTACPCQPACRRGVPACNTIPVLSTRSYSAIPPNTSLQLHTHGSVPVFQLLCFYIYRATFPGPQRATLRPPKLSPSSRCIADGLVADRVRDRIQASLRRRRSPSPSERAHSDFTMEKTVRAQRRCT